MPGNNRLRSWQHSSAARATPIQIAVSAVWQATLPLRAPVFCTSPDKTAALGEQR